MQSPDDLPPTAYVLARESNGYEPDRLLHEDGYTADQMRAYRAEGVAQERERFFAVAKSRADYEASAAAHHAGSWQSAHEYHITRYKAMSDLIEAIRAGHTTS